MSTYTTDPITGQTTSTDSQVVSTEMLLEQAKSEQAIIATAQTKLDAITAALVQKSQATGISPNELGRIQTSNVMQGRLSVQSASQ